MSITALIGLEKQILAPLVTATLRWYFSAHKGMDEETMIWRVLLIPGQGRYQIKDTGESEN